MPGPPPKPTALKELAGNPGKRALNRNEPQFGGTPVCPTWLTKDAKREWRRVVADLASIDMIRSVDTAALASYCQSYARWKSAEATVDAEGQTVQEPIVNKAGEIVGHRTKRHPATIIAKDERAAMHRAASLFGFDPASRSKINLGESGNDSADAFSTFMQSIGATNN